MPCIDGLLCVFVRPTAESDFSLADCRSWYLSLGLPRR